ncbi:MAG: homoserine O-acetyltransferase [Microlunatus sp.]|nr:homoserine O-acetyltransferase [Microlunatus sp.]
MPAWQPGDPPGRRRFVDLGPLPLEWAEPLPAVTVAYETWGQLNAERDNAVLVLHALTGDSHVTGPASPEHPSPGWWGSLIGPGQALDTDRWFVLAPNILGGCQGSTGPASPAPDARPWGSRFPRLTTRDQVNAEMAWADALGIQRWALVVGGSAGGMRAVEWSVTAPDRVQRLLLLATTAAASADQIAWCHAQIRAITTHPAWHGGDFDRSGPGPIGGLAVARQIAHITYRSATELDTRFGRADQTGELVSDGGRYAVQSYLDHHGAKLIRRFDAGSYVTLTEAMSSHDVGRDRGGIDAALARVTASTAVAAVDSDRLYLPAEGARLAAAIPTADRLETIHSDHGHDGFLIEVDAVGKLVADLLQC